MLITVLRILAAYSSGIDQLVYHTGPAGGEAPFAEARTVVEGRFAEGGPEETDSILSEITSRGLEWGVSDGD